MNDSIIYWVYALGRECSSVVECPPNMYKVLRAPLGVKKTVLWSSVTFPCFPVSFLGQLWWLVKGQAKRSLTTQTHDTSVRPAVQVSEQALPGVCGWVAPGPHSSAFLWSGGASAQHHMDVASLHRRVWVCNGRQSEAGRWDISEGSGEDHEVWVSGMGPMLPGWAVTSISGAPGRTGVVLWSQLLMSHQAMWEHGHLRSTWCALSVHVPGVLFMLEAATATSTNSVTSLPHPPPLFSTVNDPQVKHEFLRQGDVSTDPRDWSEVGPLLRIAPSWIISCWLPKSVRLASGFRFST